MELVVKSMGCFENGQDYLLFYSNGGFASLSFAANSQRKYNYRRNSAEIVPKLRRTAAECNVTDVTLLILESITFTRHCHAMCIFCKRSQGLAAFLLIPARTRVISRPNSPRTANRVRPRLSAASRNNRFGSLRSCPLPGVSDESGSRLKQSSSS